MDSQIQSGLEFGTFEFRIHSKTEHYKVRFLNVLFSNIPILNIRLKKIATSLGHFTHRKKKFFYTRPRLIAIFFSVNFCKENCGSKNEPHRPFEFRTRSEFEPPLYCYSGVCYMDVYYQNNT